VSHIKQWFLCGALIALAACGHPAEQYEGAWSNQSAGGDLKLMVERDGERVLFKVMVASNNKTVIVRSATVKDGYLVIEGGGIFSKFAYLKEGDEIISVDGPTAMPPFKRAPK
jgi:hypothetical protein